MDYLVIFSLKEKQGQYCHTVAMKASYNTKNKKHNTKNANKKYSLNKENL